jgi:uncharacterized Fe-S center protein
MLNMALHWGQDELLSEINKIEGTMVKRKEENVAYIVCLMHMKSKHNFCVICEA